MRPSKREICFNPAGAIVQAILTIYNTVMFFIERINQILDFVEAIVSSIFNIATGKIDAAANWIEKALARTIPLIIAFLARLLGLGGLSDTIKEIIKKVQTAVDKAIDMVIAKVVAGIKKLFGKGKKEDLRERAGQLVAERLPGPHTDQEIQNVVAQVREELRPQGLQQLEFQAASASGEASLVAQASDPKAVAKKKKQKKPRVGTAYVVLQARVCFDRDALKAIEQATGQQIKFYQWPIPKAWIPKTWKGEPPGGVSGLQEAAAVVAPPRGQTKTGTWLLRPPPGSKEVRIVSCNGGEPVAESAVSHAEAFFVEFFDKVYPRMKDALTEIHITINFSPCTICARATLPDVSGTNIKATLNYTIPYVGWEEDKIHKKKIVSKNTTTVEDLVMLDGRGWKVGAGCPAPEYTDAKKDLERGASKSIIEANLY